MTQSQLIAPSGPPRDKSGIIVRPNTAEWILLGAVGLSFVILGFMDLALVWYPPAFGSPEWEFGAVTTTLNGLPVTALGAMLVLASGVARRRPIAARGAALVLWALTLLVFAAAILYALSLPVALGRVTNPVVRTGLLKAAAKTSLQCLMYPTLFIWAAVRGWTAARPT